MTPASSSHRWDAIATTSSDLSGVGCTTVATLVLTSSVTHSVKFAIAAEKDKEACDSLAVTPGELTAQKERNG